ncbi:unnamed protein product [Rotaria sp. Silwood1]|nr:unnamed protein product [Rotaria sp. Silwood1]
MSIMRFKHTASVLIDGKVLISGGLWTESPRQPPIFADTELYDPATDIWTATGNMNNPRFSHKAFTLKDGKVLVIGGYDNKSLLSSAELYDPFRELWIKTTTTVHCICINEWKSFKGR